MFGGMYCTQAEIIHQKNGAKHQRTMRTLRVHRENSGDFIGIRWDIAITNSVFLHRLTKNNGWLVVWNMVFIFPYIGNNTPFHIFQRG